MRIRYKKWARNELLQSHFYVDNPEELRGKWKTKFKNPYLPLYLELGCGKGNFVANSGIKHKECNYIAIDLIDAMLGVAKRNIEKLYLEKKLNIDNIILTRYDIERIDRIFSKKDEIEKIYINFCNPWPRGKHHKRRLTHIKQLEKYKAFIKNGGEIYFKTDDDSLFLDSLKYFEECGYNIEKKTFDLHKENDFGENIETEHEIMFLNEGIKIKALIAKMIDYN